MNIDQPLLLPPGDRAQWPAWRDELVAMRRAMRALHRLDESLYTRPDLQWTSSAFVGAFAMLWDTRLYDRRRNRWTLDSFLADGDKRFGGYDFVVFWHAYPLIGVDDRNQFDFYRDMPGGLEGLRELSRILHKRNIRVFLDYNPWDEHTRREGVIDEKALANMIAAIDVDCVFLDTMEKGSGALRRQADGVRAGVAFEAEVPVSLENLGDHQMSWVEHTNEHRPNDPPGVLRNKWVERHHLHHRVARFNRDHTMELHSAWMNGCGILVWENVFGSEFLWSPRDQSLLRSMIGIQRRYAHLFSGEGWVPLVDTQLPDAYASRWEGDGVRLWTIVNRSDEERRGMALQLDLDSRMRCFDLVRGLELTASSMDLVLRPRGIGCIVALPAAQADDAFLSFLEKQRELDARADWDAVSPLSPERRKRVRRTEAMVMADIPGSMVAIPKSTFNMTATWRSRECGFYRTPMLDMQVAGGFHQLNVTHRKARVAAYAIDLTPVTNAQYAEFLQATAYQPACSVNFLKHWMNGVPPVGKEDHPVVYVDLDDARAYAAWAGKRLPTEEEWQFAAQGPDSRLWPWLERTNQTEPRWWPESEGQAMSDAGGDRVNRTNGTTSVFAHPYGRSPFGCWDMCGNTWEWTESEREDGASRFAMLKGGSYYRIENHCGWYTDGGPKPPHFSLKLILIWPGIDRKATVGFRCVRDVA